MKDHLQLCFQGFEQAIKLIYHIPDNVPFVIKKEITDEITGEFRLLQLNALDSNGNQQEILNQFATNIFLSEDQLKAEISKIVAKPIELILLIELKK